MYESTSRERLEDAIQQVIATGMPVNDLELALFTPDGRRVWLRCAAELEYENEIPHRIVGLIQDITDEHEAGERIEQLAHYDSLTGLPNRRSEEHTSDLPSLMRISLAVFSFKKKKAQQNNY